MSKQSFAFLINLYLVLPILAATYRIVPAFYLTPYVDQCTIWNEKSQTRFHLNGPTYLAFLGDSDLLDPYYLMEINNKISTRQQQHKLIHQWNPTHLDDPKIAIIKHAALVLKNEHAQYTLGAMYLGGAGVEVDAELGASLWKLAAEQHLASAAGALGQLYERGEGVETNVTTAVSWYKKCAYEDQQCAFNYGYALQVGEGTERSLSRAIEWYNRAADLGESRALYRLGTIYIGKEGGSYGISAKDCTHLMILQPFIAPALQSVYCSCSNIIVVSVFSSGTVQLALDCFNGALAGHRHRHSSIRHSSIQHIGMIYSKQKKFSKAIKMYESEWKYSKQTRYELAEFICQIYTNKEFPGQDYSMAAVWCTKAVNAWERDPNAFAVSKKWENRTRPGLGHDGTPFQPYISLHILGVLHAIGAGVPKSFKTAIRYYKRSAKFGYHESFAKIGIMYAHGQGVKKSAKKARRWFRKAAAEGNANAMYNLAANLFRKQDGKAWLWFDRAAKAGDPNAIPFLQQSCADAAKIGGALDELLQLCPTCCNHYTAIGRPAKLGNGW